MTAGSSPAIRSLARAARISPVDAGSKFRSGRARLRQACATTPFIPPRYGISGTSMRGSLPLDVSREDVQNRHTRRVVCSRLSLFGPFRRRSAASAPRQLCRIEGAVFPTGSRPRPAGNPTTALPIAEHCCTVAHTLLRSSETIGTGPIAPLDSRIEPPRFQGARRSCERWHPNCCLLRCSYESPELSEQKIERSTGCRSPRRRSSPSACASMHSLMRRMRFRSTSTK